jgi:HK97 gp10 family phage protein
MSNVTAKWTNKQKAFSRLRATVPAMEKELVKAVEKNASELTVAIKSRVPVDTGALRDAVGYSMLTGGGARNRIAASVGVSGAEVKRGKGGKSGFGAFGNQGNRFYAWFVEFGTVKMAPRPFFFPTYRFLKRRMKGRMTRAINKAVKAKTGG